MVSKNAVSAPGGPVSNVDKPAIPAKSSDSAVSTAAVTPLTGSSVHPNVNGNVQPTSSKTTAPALKMGSPPVKGIRPVTNRRNIALPVEVYSTFLYVERTRFHHQHFLKVLRICHMKLITFALGRAALVLPMVIHS